MLEAIETLILETSTRRHQLERTLQGIQQKLELELHHLKLLEQKRNELVHARHSSPVFEISVADYIAKLLQERGIAMRPSEIVAALNDNGVKSSAESGLVSAVLSALSRRKDLFKRVERGLYCLTCEELDLNRNEQRRKRIAATAR